MMGVYSDNLEMDEDGYVRYLPSLKGNYYYDNYITKLKPEIDLAYKRDTLKVGLNYRNRLQPYFTYKIIQKNLYQKHINVRTGIFGDNIIIKIDYAGLIINLSTEILDLKSSKNISGQISFSLPF